MNCRARERSRSLAGTHLDPTAAPSTGGPAKTEYPGWTQDKRVKHKVLRLSKRAESSLKSEADSDKGYMQTPAAFASPNAIFTAEARCWFRLFCAPEPYCRAD
jgi:hypothetical protein